MEQFNVLVALIRQQSAQFADILMGVCKIERPKIRVERFIHQLAVHIEEVGLRMRLWRLLRADPVKFIYSQNMVSQISVYLL